jgi:hypothetical protein
VHDSKNPTGPMFALTPLRMGRLTTGVQDGEFNRLEPDQREKLSGGPGHFSPGLPQMAPDHAPVSTAFRPLGMGARLLVETTNPMTGRLPKPRWGTSCWPRGCSWNASDSHPAPEPG